jgi:hypothetical protein
LEALLIGGEGECYGNKKEREMREERICPSGEKRKGRKRGKWGTWEREKEREGEKKEKKEKKEEKEKKGREKILTLGSVRICCDRTRVVLCVSIKILIFI